MCCAKITSQKINKDEILFGTRMSEIRNTGKIIDQLGFRVFGTTATQNLKDLRNSSPSTYSHIMADR